MSLYVFFCNKTEGIIQKDAVLDAEIQQGKRALDCI